MPTAPTAKPSVRFRSLPAYPAAHNSARTGIRMPGKLTYADIVTRLNTELTELKAANIVLESGHDADDLRLDGHLKNDAKPPRFPGVVLRLHATLTPEP